MKREVRTAGTENFFKLCKWKESQGVMSRGRLTLRNGRAGQGWGTGSHNRFEVNICSVFYFVPIICSKNAFRH